MQKDSCALHTAKGPTADLQRQMNPESRTMLPKMAFTGFASRYREPTLDEGFDDITKVNFKVCLRWRLLGLANDWNPARSLQ